MKSHLNRLTWTLLALLLTGIPKIALAAPDTLFVYGPGGPLPAMKEAAAAFEKEHGIVVSVTGGPTDQWIERARNRAHVIFSGSEHMMTDFVRLMEGQIEESTIEPLYLRPSAILVRPGNPKRITRFEDLLKPGLRILVVQGAGQTGLWEDMAGRKGDIGTVRALRRNIAVFAPNSGVAKEAWTRQSELDAWIIWNIWHVANPGLTDLVPVSPEWVIYRDSGVALTRRGTGEAPARRFIAFLQSAQGAAIFEKWGWITEHTRPGR